MKVAFFYTCPMLNIDSRLRQQIKDKCNKPACSMWLIQCLAERMNNDAECWPSVPTISKDSGFSEPKVRRLIKELKKLKILSYKTRSNSSHKYKMPKGITKYTPQQNEHPPTKRTGAQNEHYPPNKTNTTPPTKRTGEVLINEVLYIELLEYKEHTQKKIKKIQEKVRQLQNENKELSKQLKQDQEKEKNSAKKESLTDLREFEGPNKNAIVQDHLRTMKIKKMYPAAWSANLVNLFETFCYYFNGREFGRWGVQAFQIKQKVKEFEENRAKYGEKVLFSHVKDVMTNNKKTINCLYWVRKQESEPQQKPISMKEAYKTQHEKLMQKYG